MAARNLLKFAARCAIFCPGCEQILDWRRTVNATKGEQSITRCATCWDKTIDALKEKHPAEKVAAFLAEWDIVDGRIISRRIVREKGGMA